MRWSSVAKSNTPRSDTTYRIWWKRAARPDAIEGSLQYTAPEYFIGGAGSARSDLFSLAVLTYQMLTGHLPYGVQVTRLRTPGDLKSLRYIPVRQHRPDLPPWLDAVLRRALHPQPARRQEALSEFVHDLRHPPRHAGPASLPLIERGQLIPLFGGDSQGATSAQLPPLNYVGVVNTSDSGSPVNGSGIV